MTTLVTGATGLVGNNVTRLLIQQGAPVRVLVRASSDPRPLQGLNVEIVEGDETRLVMEPVLDRWIGPELRKLENLAVLHWKPSAEEEKPADLPALNRWLSQGRYDLIASQIKTVERHGLRHPILEWLKTTLSRMHSRTNISFPSSTIANSSSTPILLM